MKNGTACVLVIVFSAIYWAIMFADLVAGDEMHLIFTAAASLQFLLLMIYLELRGRA